jgi:hypothetical protein
MSDEKDRTSAGVPWRKWCSDWRLLLNQVPVCSAARKAPREAAEFLWLAYSQAALFCCNAMTFWLFKI